MNNKTHRKLKKQRTLINSYDFSSENKNIFQRTSKTEAHSPEPNQQRQKDNLKEKARFALKSEKRAKYSKCKLKYGPPVFLELENGKMLSKELKELKEMEEGDFINYKCYIMRNKITNLNKVALKIQPRILTNNIKNLRASKPFYPSRATILEAYLQTLVQNGWNKLQMDLDLGVDGDLDVNGVKDEDALMRKALQHVKELNCMKRKRFQYYPPDKSKSTNVSPKRINKRITKPLPLFIPNSNRNLGAQGIYYSQSQRGSNYFKSNPNPTSNILYQYTAPALS
jgi:hypothetical protein